MLFSLVYLLAGNCNTTRSLCARMPENRNNVGNIDGQESECGNYNFCWVLCASKSLEVCFHSQTLSSHNRCECVVWYQVNSVVRFPCAMKVTDWLIEQSINLRNTVSQLRPTFGCSNRNKEKLSPPTYHSLLIFNKSLPHLNLKETKIRSTMRN